MLKMKRIYEQPSAEDGYRVLVDRLWPRGVAKTAAKIDYWAKEITPSTALRKTFNHDAETFAAFRQAYLYELETNRQGEAFLQLLREKLATGPVTLLYAAKNEQINHVVVLMEWIKKNEPRRTAKGALKS